MRFLHFPTNFFNVWLMFVSLLRVGTLMGSYGGVFYIQAVPFFTPLACFRWEGRARASSRRIFPTMR